MSAERIDRLLQQKKKILNFHNTKYYEINRYVENNDAMKRNDVDENEILSKFENEIFISETNDAISNI